GTVFKSVKLVNGEIAKRVVKQAKRAINVVFIEILFQRIVHVHIIIGTGNGEQRQHTNRDKGRKSHSQICAKVCTGQIPQSPPKAVHKGDTKITKKRFERPPKFIFTPFERRK